MSEITTVIQYVRMFVANRVSGLGCVAVCALLFLAVANCLLRYAGWISATTDNGEACLHLAGIYGHSDVTTLLLQKGANPNIRSTWKDGLRMHPLSWNVYGGHVENAKLLLENGADINAHFDSMVDSDQSVTVTDVALKLVEVEEGDQRYEKMLSLLRSHGGKTMEEMRISKEL